MVSYCIPSREVKFCEPWTLTASPCDTLVPRDGTLSDFVVHLQVESQNRLRPFKICVYVARAKRDKQRCDRDCVYKKTKIACEFEYTGDCDKRECYSDCQIVRCKLPVSTCDLLQVVCTSQQPNSMCATIKVNASAVYCFASD